MGQANEAPMKQATNGDGVTFQLRARTMSQVDFMLGINMGRHQNKDATRKYLASTLPERQQGYGNIK